MRRDIKLYRAEISARSSAVVIEASSGPLHSLQANIRIVPQIWTRQFPFTYIQIYYSLIILSFDAI
jgi:hypothetical protein